MRQEDVEPAHAARTADAQLGRFLGVRLEGQHLLGRILDGDVRQLFDVVRDVGRGLLVRGRPRLERKRWELAAAGVIGLYSSDPAKGPKSYRTACAPRPYARHTYHACNTRMQEPCRSARQICHQPTPPRGISGGEAFLWGTRHHPA